MGKQNSMKKLELCTYTRLLIMIVSSCKSFCYAIVYSGMGGSVLRFLGVYMCKMFEHLKFCNSNPGKWVVIRTAHCIWISLLLCFGFGFTETMAVLILMLAFQWSDAIHATVGGPIDMICPPRQLLDAFLARKGISCYT